MKLLQSSKGRHLAKTITWRIIGTIDTMFLAWIITGDAITGLKIGGFEVITKMTLYYLHERAWYKINIGLDRPKTIGTDITWNPSPGKSYHQVGFFQYEKDNIRKRVKVTSDGMTYNALLSFYNKETKERYSDIISADKQTIEKQLNIKI